MKNLFSTCLVLFSAGYLFSQRPNFSDMGGFCAARGRFGGFDPTSNPIKVLCHPDPSSCCVMVYGIGGGFYRASFFDDSDGKFKHFVVKDKIISENELILDDKKYNVYTFELVTP